jgi:hypothetical protein
MLSQLILDSFYPTRSCGSRIWSINVIICSVCGGSAFEERGILWDKLVFEW